MLTKLKRSWRSLRDAPPGERFTRYYRNHHDADRAWWKRALSFGVALLVIAVGIVALPAPGPGTLVLALGGALLGRELLPVARALDWVEVRLRRVLSWGKRSWKHASPLGRVGLAAIAIVVALALAATAGFAAYRMVRG